MHFIWGCICLSVLQGCACTPSETASSMPVVQVCFLASCNLSDASRGAAQDKVGGGITADFTETVKQESTQETSLDVSP